MDKLERMCRDLLIEARRQGVSNFELAKLLRNEMLASRTDLQSDGTEFIHFISDDVKEENNKAEKEMKVVSVRKEYDRLLSDIEEQYGEKIERLKNTMAEEILYATSEVQKDQVIKRFWKESEQIESEKSRQIKKLKRESFKKLVNML